MKKININSKRYKDRKKICGQIFEIIIKYKKELKILFLIQFLFLICAVCPPYLYGLLIDDVLVGRKMEVLWLICIGYSILFIFDSLLSIVQKKIQVKTFNNLKLDIREKMWKKYMEAPYVFFEQYGNGSLKQRVDTDVDSFECFFDEQIIRYFFNVVCIIAYLIIIFMLSWKLAVFSLVMVPVAFWLTKRMAKGSADAWKRYGENYGKYEGWLKSSLQNWKEIKTLRAEDNQLKLLDKYWELLKPDFYKGCLYFYINRSFIGFSDFFITKMNLYFLGGLLIFSGDLKIGMLFVFMKYYEKFFAGITELTNSDMKLAEYNASINRVLEIFELKFDRKKICVNELNNYNIKFNHVNFKYGIDRKCVLADINLDIEENSCIAIVGRSGSGKTTLIKLLLGLYEEYSGEIMIGNLNIQEVKLRKNISVVMQDSILFNQSVFENICMAKEDATKEDVINACKNACIHDDIMQMPKQYDTIIGERGIQVSGGQRQRIAIARALVSKPRILIFDEATSALDSVAERGINQTLKLLKRTCTIIIIAHRLSSIMESDQVVVLNDSTIVEKGKYSELMVKGTVFNEVFHEQYNFYEGDLNEKY